MERYVYKELENWAIRSRRKPLIIRGARQVGKTWLVENLARVEFDYLMKVDFEESPELISLFEGDLNTQKICAELELRSGVDIVEGKTLLFLDEIQLCPRAIISLRYFYEQIPGLHVIAAGSLLEFAFGEISFPVGRIQSLEVNPMNFSEFLLATGHAKAAEICSNPVVEVSVAIHNFLLGLLREYWMVGGMPESVLEYIQTKSIKSATEVQDEIYSTFHLDFNKYKPKTDIICLKNVFSNIALNVGKQVKYTGLAKDSTIPTIKKAYESLVLARVVKKVRSVSSPGIPLLAHSSDKKFKSLFLDIGLMNRAMGIVYSEALNHSNLLAIYRGQLAEQFVGQEFVSASEDSLHYWARDAKSSSAEVDFMWLVNTDLIPIEVKDGPSGRLRSLHLYRNSYNPPYSVVFHSGRLGILEEEKIVFLPLYYAGSFARHGIQWDR